MKIDQRKTVRSIVRGCLEEQYPEYVSEFDSDFPSIYIGIEKLEKLEKEAEKKAKPKTREKYREEMACDIVGESAVVAIACFAGYALLKAALKDSAKRDLPKLLDKLETEFSELTGRPKLVSAIRRRVEGILQALE